MRCLPDRLIAAQVVELRVDAVADGAAVAHHRRRVVEDRALEVLSKIREIVELGDQAADERRLQMLEQHPDSGHGRKRLAQRHQVARPGRPERRARHETLHVVHRLERVLHLGALGAPERELFDGVEPILNALDREQRPQHPRPQHPAAHRGDGAIDFVQQGSGPSAVRRFHHLQVRQRRRIDNQAVGAGSIGDFADVREVRLLRFTQVVHERTGGADGGGMLFQAEPEETLRLQL